MIRIALTGNIGSGKSSVATLLSEKGMYLLNYSEQIKDEVAKAMTTVELFASNEEALSELHERKEFYRPLLVAWADTCGWSDGRQLKKFLEKTDKKDIVLDNIRYLVQAHIVKAHGFVTLKLEGGDRMDIPELLDYPFDATIPWMDNVEERVEYIWNLVPTLQK